MFNQSEKVISILGEPLTHPPFLGVERFCFELLLALDKLLDHKKTDYLFEIIIPCGSAIKCQFKNIKIINFGSNKRSFLWKQISFPNYCKKRHSISCDLMLGLPLVGSDIVAIHDCIYEKCPDDMTGGISKIKRVSYLLKTRANLKKAKIVLTVSKSSKEDIVDIYHISPSKIFVLYNGWQHFQNFTPNPKVLVKYGLTAKKYFLFIGSKLKHKNTGYVFKFAEKHPSEKIIVIGNPFLNDARCKSFKNVLFIDRVDDEIMGSLIFYCDFLIFPSLAEGFGIPPLEAMALQAKTAVFDIPVFQEIYGNSVCYLSDNGEINESSFSYDSVNKCLNSYSWEKTASLFLDSINTLETKAD